MTKSSPDYHSSTLLYDGLVPHREETKIRGGQKEDLGVEQEHVPSGCVILARVVFGPIKQPSPMLTRAIGESRTVKLRLMKVVAPMCKLVP
jgi:hypothetical protein